MRRTKKSTIGDGSRDRQVLLVKDLDDETLDLIRNAEIPEESRRLGYLMEDPETE